MTPSPKIVVLDGFTLVPASGPGEPDWDGFRQLGDLQVYDRTAPQQVISRIGQAKIVLTNKTGLDAQVLARVPHVRYIGVLATGVNVVDLDQATRQGIVVTNVPGYGAASVAQHVFALLLELTNAVATHDQAVRQGEWSRCGEFCFTVQPIVQLAGKSIGIIGLGAIGKQVAAIAHAFGMSILAAHQSSREQVRLPQVDIEWLWHDEIFSRADVLSLHCPLTDQTRHLVNEQRLKIMKSTAYLINTSRGGLIDEPALAAALAAGRIAGAGLDVLSAEPPPADHPLLRAPRCLITPHNAWASQAARRRLMEIAIENLAAFLRGEKRNVVNGI